MNSAPKAPTILATVAVAAIPLLIWIEKSENTLWNSRLFTPDSDFQQPLHEPVITEGQFLPPTIQKDTTLTSDTPIIIPGTVTVSSGATLTIEPGSRIFVHEFGRLNVEGRLIANGTTDNPIRFTTNENNTMNRSWSGIVFMPESSGELSHTTIGYGFPGITCEEKSNVAISNATIELGNVGVFTESQSCTVANSTIRYVDTGVISKGVSVEFPNTAISAKRNQSREF